MAKVIEKIISLEWCSIRSLFRAVVHAYGHMLDEGEEPGSEKWQMGLWEILKSRIITSWSDDSRNLCPEAIPFPWTDDTVKWAWVTYRKLSAERKVVFAKWLDDENWQ